jgi:hypothetical protein
MSHRKVDKASNVPSSGSDLGDMESGAQTSIFGAEGATAQATSIAQSRPRRAAAGGASTIQQHGGPRRNHGATGTSSRAAEKSTAGYPNVSYGPDGVTIWEPRPLPKIKQDLMKPVPKSGIAEPSVAA